MDTSRDSHTFLFADLAGFTALTEAHGDQAAADMAASFCRAVRALLPDNAEEVKTIGDAILLRFASATAAVQLAIRVVSEVGGTPEFPVVRAGLHTGTAVSRDGDWFGAGVNLAARVTVAAAGGEVLLSEATRNAAGDVAGVDFHPRGEHRLRNVSADVTMYLAVPTGRRITPLPIDPVCRMAVDPARSRRLFHEGFERHFCSQRCLEIFRGDPERHMDVRGAAL